MKYNGELPAIVKSQMVSKKMKIVWSRKEQSDGDITISEYLNFKQQAFIEQDKSSWTNPERSKTHKAN